ncbi:MAG: DUF2238 domain-containing protein [Minisyncoccia bacterium]
MEPIISRGRILVLAFTLLYVFIFSTWFITQGNYEFIWYVSVMFVIMAIIACTLRTSAFPNYILWMLSVWGLLHMLGGGIPVGDSVLYGYRLFDLYTGSSPDFVLLKYDQVVHAYGFAVAAIALAHILSLRAQGFGMFGRVMFAALGAIGLSVLNEIIEFAAVLMLPDTWVGGYYNISLDLVFNTLGAFVGVLLFEYFHRNHSKTGSS